MQSHTGENSHPKKLKNSDSPKSLSVSGIHPKRGISSCYLLSSLSRESRGEYPVCSHLDKLFHLTAMATGELAVAFHPPEVQHEDILFLGNKTVKNNTV